MHHKRRRGCISHLASGRDGNKLFFPGFFILLALLEESFRNFDVLHDQRMSFWSRSREPAIFTVALGTLDRQQERQNSGNRPGDG